MKSISITFAGINFPEADFGYPFDVNQTFNLPSTGGHTYLLQSKPDANGVYVYIKVNDTGTPGEQRVLFRLYKDAGKTYMDIFFAFGSSPFQNETTYGAKGGTATIS